VATAEEATVATSLAGPPPEPVQALADVPLP
jgi:hypothetical protein